MSDRDGENTPPKHRGGLKEPWLPGQSGNPAGRPKGSRNKLGEAFVEAMHSDFMEHGQAVVRQVRTEKPDQYLKVIASLLPKELHVTNESLGDMSDDELIELLAAVRSLTASVGATAPRKRTGKARGDKEAGSKPH